MGIEFIVAPYEADAQLAYMYKTGRADVVITEDSDLIAFGVKKKFRGRGIESVIFAEALKYGRKMGFTGCEASWILEDNVAMNKPWTDLGAPQYRRWRIYEKPIAKATSGAISS